MLKALNMSTVGVETVLIIRFGAILVETFCTGIPVLEILVAVNIVVIT